LIVMLWVMSALCGLSDFIMSAGADEAACDDLFLVVDRTFCRRVHCTNFDSQLVICPLVVVIFVAMAVLYGKVCRRLRVTSSVDHGRFMRRQYRGLRTSATVLLAFFVAWFPYCTFVTAIYILLAVDIDLSFCTATTECRRNDVVCTICLFVPASATTADVNSHAWRRE